MLLSTPALASHAVTGVISGVIQYSRKSRRRSRWSPRKVLEDPGRNRECPLSAVRPSLSGTNLSDFGQHAAPITAGPAAPFFQNVSASLYGTLRFVFDDFGQWVLDLALRSGVVCRHGLLKVANWQVTGFNPKCRTTENW